MNTDKSIRKRVASGAFEHNGKAVTYEMFSDSKNLFVKIEIDGNEFEYQRNQSLNFREDFLNNIPK